MDRHIFQKHIFRQLACRFPHPWTHRMLALALSLCVALAAIGPVWGEEELYPLQAATYVRSILREGPGTSYRQVQVFNAGTNITLLGKEGDWFLVQSGQHIGYMRQDLVAVSGALGTIQAYADDGFNGDSYLPPPPPPGAASAPIIEEMQEMQEIKETEKMGEAEGTPASSPVPEAAAALAPPPSGSQLGTRVLKQGSKGADVLELQGLLLQHGYNPNGLDGIFGPGTRTAVTRFQVQSGIRADGIVGAQTVGRLVGGALPPSDGEPSASVPPLGNEGIPEETPAPSTPAPTPLPPPSLDTQQGSTSVSHLRPSKPYQMLSKGSSGAAVTSLQTALQILGYYTGKITGSYDAATTDAVKAFQANNGTGVDGIAGSATQTILYEQTPRSAGETAPGPNPLPEGAGKMSGPSAGQVELGHWFNDIKLKYRVGQTFAVYDPATGLGWNLRFYAMGNHADSEPLTQLDTDIMFKAFGYVNTWTPKPVYVRMPDGRWVVAAMHNVPHLSGSVKDNGFNGHLCVHFYRDMEEAIRNDPNYGVQNQNVIRAAWERLKR